MKRLMKQFDLSGRTALITGGGSGIGRGCALILAAAGASVIVAGRREEALNQTKAQINSAGGICEIYPADVTSEDSCRKMVEFCVQRFDRLDILINSAGSRGNHGGLEQEFAAENLRNTMAVDFEGTFLPIKYAYPECAKNGVGSIINIASLAALSARGPIVYTAAKGAVRSLSKILAQRFGSMGIRVNTIYPGFIITEMTEKISEHPEIEAKYRAESPLGLLGKVEDIGYCALYLASDASEFVTGQDFVIDGGATC